MFFRSKIKGKSKNKNITTKQNRLKLRTISVIKWDKYHIKKYNKSSVNVLKSDNDSKKDTVVSILPYLKHDYSNLGGFLA